MARRLMPAVRLLWVAGFLVGTTTHVLDLVAGGAQVYAGYPAAVRAFWVALTVLDPLVVALLLLRRPSAVVLGVAVVAVDVAVNWTVHATVGGGTTRALLTLTAFTALVLATARPLRRWLAGPRPARRDSGRAEDRT